jgi:hypothetical protein
MMSLPSDLSRAARAVTANVGEGLTFCTRFEREMVKVITYIEDGAGLYEK